MYVVDPETLATTTIGTTGGTASADADATTIFTVDRSNDRIEAYDPTTGEKVASLPLGANPDYVRVAGGGELWVTVPAAAVASFAITDELSFTRSSKRTAARRVGSSLVRASGGRTIASG